MAVREFTHVRDRQLLVDPPAGIQRIGLVNHHTINGCLQHEALLLLRNPVQLNKFRSQRLGEDLT